MRTSRAAAFPLAAAVVLAVPGCGFGTPSQVLPGLAHPMASSEEGYHVSDEATLHERIKVVERRLLVEVLAALATRGLTLTGRKATIG